MDLQKPFIFLALGAPRSGKSWLSKFILLSEVMKGSFNHVVVFSASAFNGDWDCVPGRYVQAFSDEKLAAFIELQQETRQPCLLILDDLLGSASFSQKAFDKLFSIHRHLNVSIICISQWVSKLPPLIRECCSHAAIFKQYQTRAFKVLFENFGSKFKDENAFKEFLEKGTKQQYSFLLYDKLADSYKPMVAPQYLPDVKIVF